MTNYQEAKHQLTAISKLVKSNNKRDKAAIREAINNYTDAICKDWQSFKLTEHQQTLLNNYAAKLHP